MYYHSTDPSLYKSNWHKSPAIINALHVQEMLTNHNTTVSFPVDLTLWKTKVNVNTKTYILLEENAISAISVETF
jgi:hypothetical protein